MLKMVDGTGIIGVDMVCPLGGAVSPPQPPNYDNVEMEGVGSLMLPNSLKAPLERLELIGNNTQGENPAPDNPQEIKSAGRKSKNLFNIADLRVGQVQKDGTINEKQIYYRTVILDVPQDGKYRITFNSNDDYTMLYFTEAYANGAYSKPYIRVQAGNPNHYITLEKGKNILSFSTHTASGNIAFTTDHNIMIAAESETLGYEPYGYLLDVKVTGKNLFNAEKAKDANNWTSSAILPSYKEFSIYVGKGNSVNISYLENLETGLGFYANIAHSKNDYTMYWLYHSDSEINITKNKNFIAMNDYIVLRVDAGSVPKFFEYIKTLQIEIGSKQTPYEPYTEQSMQIALDEPLRGIGEYKDVLTKDGVVRRIKQITVDEKSNLIFYTESKNTFGYLVKVPDATQTNYIYSVISDRFVKTQYIDSNDTNGVVTLFGKQIIFRVSKEIANSIDALKEWLANNNITFNYVLESPITEPLPESVQAQLSAMHSENGTTYVFVDSGEVPCGIKLTYRKEK